MSVIVAVLSVLLLNSMLLKVGQAELVVESDPFVFCFFAEERSTEGKLTISVIALILLVRLTASW